MHHISLSLTKQDVSRLHTFTKTGTHKAREINRAQILLLLREGMSAEVAGSRVRVSTRTVKRVAGRFKGGGLDRALFDAPRSGQPRKTDDTDDAHLVAIACTDAPKGSEHWTLDLLVKRFAKDRKKRLGRSTVCLRLSERGIKPWREKNVVHPEDHAGIHRADGRHSRTVRVAV